MNKILVIGAIAAGALFAQERAPEAGIQMRTARIDADNAVHTGDMTRAAQTAQFVSALNVGPTITGAPYAAEAVTESVQKLYDGNRIVQKSSTKQYRDSEGRERREEGAPMNAVFITDPVEKVNYTLHPDSKTASKTSGGGMFLFQSFQGANAKPVGAFNGTVSVAPMAAVLPGGRGGNINVVTTNNTFGYATTRTVSATPGMQISIGPEPGAAKIEDLGTQMIEGVQVKGTRATTIIPTGQIGNDRDIEVVDERWYSPELQLTVMTRHTDPRVGENTYKLTNIQRIEQVRSLFEIPPNYTIATDNVFGGRGVRYTEGFPTPTPAPAKKEE